MTDVVCKRAWGVDDDWWHIVYADGGGRPLAWASIEGTGEVMRALAKQILRDVPAPTMPAPALSALSAPSRPETGPMRFGDDWPGLFIRGDNCVQYVIALREALYALSNPGVRLDPSPFGAAATLADLARLLGSTDQRAAAPCTDLRPFAECLPPRGEP